MHLLCISGYAELVNVGDLPFVVNWCGPEIKPMTVNDAACVDAMISIIRSIDELQPKIEGVYDGCLNVLLTLISGLGICLLVEFARVMLYNVLVDEESTDLNEETELHGYKQMILILQSRCVETGKSFFSELLSRIYHGKKQNIHSVLSFESAKALLSKGDPIIIGM